jgi:Protein of unknown function (DUF3383)
MASFETCPSVCNADLATDLISTFTLTDDTAVFDATCNGVLFLTDDPGLNDTATPLSGPWLKAAGPRTKVVSSLAEIAAHYSVNSQTYKAAKIFFANAGQRGVAPYYMLGFWNEAGAESAPTALDAINDCNPCWRHLALVHFKKNGTTKLMDAVVNDAVADWAQANGKIGYFMSIDPNTKSPANTTNLKARLFSLGIVDHYVHYSEGQCETARDPVTGAIQYFAIGAAITDADGNPVIDPATSLQAISDGTTPISVKVYPYTEFLTAGWAANVDLSQTNSGYTLAYKPQGGAGFIGVTPSDLSNGEVTSVTGVFPDGTLNPNNNGYANVYVRTSGRNGIYPGISVGGSWIDQVHLKLHVQRQIRSALAGLFFNNRRVPYDDARGKAMLANAVSNVVSAAQSAGHFTNDAVNWEASGEYVRKGLGWVIRQDSFAGQTAARKNARLAPQLRVCYVPAGGINHVPVTLCALAVPGTV